MPRTIPRRFVLRARRAAVLRDALPREARLAVRRLPQAHRGPLHHRHVQEVPPRTLCVRFLSTTVK